MKLSVGKEFQKGKSFEVHFSSALACCYSALAQSHARSRPVTVSMPQSPPLEAHLSGSLSLILSPAPTDLHHWRDSGQPATRVSGQSCPVLPRPIPVTTDRRLRAVLSPHPYCVAAALLSRGHTRMLTKLSHSTPY
jgi:hypothetical protein